MDKCAKKFEEVQDKLEKVYSIVRQKYDMNLVNYGDLSSDKVFYLDFEKTNDDIMKLFKEAFGKIKVDFYSVSFFVINKTENENLNKKIALKELEAINPKRVGIISDRNILGDKATAFLDIEKINIIIRKKYKGINEDKELCVSCLKELTAFLQKMFNK